MKNLMIALAAGALVLGSAGAVAASPKPAVDMAKAAGLVGEQADGYVGFVTPTDDPVVRDAVAQMNAARKGLYDETAARTGVTSEVAGQASFTQRFAAMASGTFVKSLDGVWTRKP